MIKIRIETDGNRITDLCNIKKVTIGEVGLALVRLKQIEHELINIKFRNDLDIVKKD